VEAANAKEPQNFKDLLVWQRGMALAKWIYEITRTFPSDERFGLVAQMRRPPCRFRPTLQKDKHDTLPENLFSSFLMQEAR
jgi:23S rRNA-intervening sequence protein